MVDILHRVGIDSTSQKVFNALTTIDGLSHWWIVPTKGKPKRGGVINFGLCSMKVLQATPNKLVEWKCVRGPKEWINMRVTFRLKRKDGQTFVIFSHADWKKPVEFMHHCSTKWATFLLSLKNWLEREEGRPYPYGVKLHVGD